MKRAVLAALAALFLSASALAAIPPAGTTVGITTFCETLDDTKKLVDLIVAGDAAAIRAYLDAQDNTCAYTGGPQVPAVIVEVVVEHNGYKIVKLKAGDKFIYAITRD